MLSQKFATPLRLQVNHSRRLRAVVISFFILSLLALLLAQFSLLLKLPIILGVVGLFFSAWRARPELAGETVELILRPNGAWLLERKGESIALQLHGRRRFDYLLWQVEQPTILFRRLRVYLRLYTDDALR